MIEYPIRSLLKKHGYTDLEITSMIIEMSTKKLSLVRIITRYRNTR